VARSLPDRAFRRRPALVDGPGGEDSFAFASCSNAAQSGLAFSGDRHRALFPDRGDASREGAGHELGVFEGALEDFGGRLLMDAAEVGQVWM